MKKLKKIMQQENIPLEKPITEDAKETPKQVQVKEEILNENNNINNNNLNVDTNNINQTEQTKQDNSKQEEKSKSQNKDPISSEQQKKM